MRSRFSCTECSADVIVPLKVTTVSCRRCGDVSFVNDGAPRRYYPALSMYPIDHQSDCSAVSKWMLPWTRPIRAGVYDCRFRHTEPHVIRLRWNGAGFVVPDTGERVSMRYFLTWRGMLA